jgi:hypothetical protein
MDIVSQKKIRQGSIQAANFSTYGKLGPISLRLSVAIIGIVRVGVAIVELVLLKFGGGNLKLLQITMRMTGG